MSVKPIAQNILSSLKRLQKLTSKLPVGPDREFAKLMDSSFEGNLEKIDQKLLSFLPDLIHEGIKIDNIGKSFPTLVESVNDSIELSIPDVVCNHLLVNF
jgi:hypothetical protein